MCGMKALLLNFLLGVGFCWWIVSTYFWVKNPGGCTKSRFPEDLRTERLGGEAVVLRCVYLFVCLFVVCLCVCFLFALRRLFVGSCVNYVVWCRWCGGGGVGVGVAVFVEFCGGFGGFALSCCVFLWV